MRDNFAMNSTVCVVSGTEGTAASFAITAARSVYPEAAVRLASSLDNALGPSPATGEILVLVNGTVSDAGRAAAETDDQHLPRWAVVARGEFPAPAGVTLVPSANWETEGLAQALRSAPGLFRLRREIARLRGELLSVGVRIAHDLRSPLGGIITGAEAVREGLPATAGGGAAAAQPILESVDDLVRVISRLALWAKTEGNDALREKFDMALPIGFAAMKAERRLGARGLTLSRPATWPSVTGDPARTEEAWNLLLENAIAHAPDGATIEVGWEKSGAEVRFWMRAAGRAIAPEKIPTLFTPFHRLHEPNAVRGLGLSIAERLIASQGGRCGYDPQVGTFYFVLPE